MGEGVSLVSEFGSIGYLNYCDGMRGRSVITWNLFTSSFVLSFVISAYADGGPHSWVWRTYLRSASKYIPQPIQKDLQSLRTIRKCSPPCPSVVFHMVFPKTRVFPMTRVFPEQHFLFWSERRCADGLVTTVNAVFLPLLLSLFPETLEVLPEFVKHFKQ